MITSPSNVFANSLTLENKFQKLEDFLKVYEEHKNNNHFSVTEIPFHALDKWKFNNDEYLGHESGKFFKIEGLKVTTNFGQCTQWMQPIINQPEIGILGLITKVFDGARYFLMQLKMEPGNVNILQLSPTVQATKSNFSQVHKGKSVLFLEYFTDKTKSLILIDQLQSEQGGRFLRKRNRNMVVEVVENIEVPENFFWLTLGEIKKLLHINNFVNMDARSVISTIPLQPTFQMPRYCDDEILRWYIDQKVEYELEVEKVSLKNLELNGWGRNSHKIFKNDRLFSVIAIKVETGSREVTSWTQPIIKDLNVGLVGFIVKNFNNTPHYLVQTKVMPGNIDIIDMSPTVSVSNYAHAAYNSTCYKPKFIEYFSYDVAKNKKIIYSALQSEEGGRFYHLQNLNMIVQMDDNEDIDIPNNFIWITRDQMNKFMPYGMFNIEARSLISSI
jgi:oxidase EvaA